MVQRRHCLIKDIFKCWGSNSFSLILLRLLIFNFLVIVDLAAERGGNCDLTQQGKTIMAHDVTIIGPENVPSELAYHASQMYGKNMQTLLELILDDNGNLHLNFDDEIVAGTVVAHQNDVPHAHVRKLLGLSEISVAGTPEQEKAEDTPTTDQK